MACRKSRRAKAVDIPAKVKSKVFLRDEGRCVACGNTVNVMPNAHIVPRSAGGLGVETNIVTLCTDFTPLMCHKKYDQGTAEEMQQIEERITEHMKKHYGDSWCREDQVYRKWEDL